MSPPRYTTYKNVAAIADRLLTISGAPRLRNGVAIDVFTIARDVCGFDVAEVPDLNLGGPLLGAFVPDYDLILLKENCMDGRKRFSLGHELGHAQIEHSFGQSASLFGSGVTMHFRCEDEDIDMGVAAQSRRPRSEILANKFAAYLLMPEATIRELWKSGIGTSEAAGLLFVSRRALSIRYEELGLTLPHGK
jgi:Zn-dependent peptidase ImmA (M78 family)